MPIFEFECLQETCHTVTEKLLLSHQLDSHVLCTACGGETHKILSRSAIHFKGTGWTSKADRHNTSAGQEDGKDARVY